MTSICPSSSKSVTVLGSGLLRLSPVGCREYFLPCNSHSYKTKDPKKSIPGLQGPGHLHLEKTVVRKFPQPFDSDYREISEATFFSLPLKKLDENKSTTRLGPKGDALRAPLSQKKCQTPFARLLDF